MMEQKDYTPYRVVEGQPGSLTLQLNKRHQVLRLFLFRIVPWFLLLCLSLTHESLSREMPEWLYGAWFLLIAGLSVYLLLHRYDVEIVLTKGSITRKLDFLYMSCDETETLHETDSMSVVQERGGRSVYWAFYLTQAGQKKRILHVPIFLDENLQARNNLAQAFELICGIKVFFPE